MRILIVLSDQADQPHDPAGVCTDRYATLKTKLELDRVEAALRKVALQYTGQSLLDFQWTVLAGINKSDFDPNGSPYIGSMGDALMTYLISKGCIPDKAAFDKTILITPLLQIPGGFTGVAELNGRVGMRVINDQLMVHELLHTFGASDLYLTLAGRLQYLSDWMSVGSINVPDRQAGVAWAEIGMGDMNRDGVIDLFEFARYPSSLTLVKAAGTITGKDTLEVTADIRGEEAGVAKRTLIRDMLVMLADGSGTKTLRPGTVAVFEGGKEVDLAAIKASGSIDLRFQASLRFTDAAFRRQTLTLDVTQTVPVK